MRILVALSTHYPHSGGVSSHVRTLVKGLKKNGHEVFIFSLSSYPLLIRKAFMVLQLFLNSIRKGLGLPIGAFTFKFFTQIILFFYCLAKKIEVIHAHDCIALNSACFVRRLLGIPTVLTIHGYLVLEQIADSNIERQAFTLINLYAREEKEAYQKAEHIITVDFRLKKYVSRLSVEKFKSTVIKNFVDADAFTTNLDKMICRGMFNLPRDKSIILIPRRLVEKCGVMEPLYSLQYIPASLKHKVLLVYCGLGPKKREIEKYIRDHRISNVILLGAVPHGRMKYVYKASDVVLIPSIPISGVEEATSISALEAMAVGLPVIASNIGGLREIITNEDNGVLVPPGDPELLANAIITILTNTEFSSRIAYQAQRFTRAFSIDRTLKKVLSIYHKVSKNKKCV